MTIDRQLAKIIADSRSPHGVRLTTMEVVMPRIVLAEFNTHRQLRGDDPADDMIAPFSRNSASSRAIPIDKMLARLRDDPYFPDQWDRNGTGMQGHGPLEGDEHAAADAAWQRGIERAILTAEELRDTKVHKQWSNRALEPFMWHTVIVTSTEWANFFHQRCHPHAHPAIRRTAEAMRDAYEAATPQRLQFGEWHLPFVDERDAALPRHDKVKVSVARCARVSYLTHDGVRDPQQDIDLHDRLLAAGHMSPYEHVARPMNVLDAEAALLKFCGVTGIDRSALDPSEHFSGNLRGWVQYRKTIAGEADILGSRSVQS